jgi:hypothetical protein
MGAAAEKKADSRPSHLWTSSAEPHAQRRKLMLQKYGAQVGRGAAPCAVRVRTLLGRPLQ